MYTIFGLTFTGIVEPAACQNASFAPVTLACNRKKLELGGFCCNSVHQRYNASLALQVVPIPETILSQTSHELRYWYAEKNSD
jgi:hypothetical protein